MKTQIWIAISFYLPVAILLKLLGIETSLYQLPQISALPSSRQPALCGHFRDSIPKMSYRLLPTS
jgi:hypothetical protein